MQDLGPDVARHAAAAADARRNTPYVVVVQGEPFRQTHKEHNAHGALPVLADDDAFLAENRCQISVFSNIRRDKDLTQINID